MARRNAEARARSDREYYVENRDEILERQAAYREANRERIVARMRQHYQENSESKRAGAREHRRLHPEHGRATRAVQFAVERGDLPRVADQKCNRCGGAAQQYHHADYGEPLEVEPLCRSCHRRHHNDLRKEVQDG